jgi:hypothetical protein
MLLAAIERHLPVSYVEAGLYQVDEGAFDGWTMGDSQPIEIWLTGEPYRAEGQDGNQQETQ